MKPFPFLTEECETTQGLDPRWCGLCGDQDTTRLLVIQEHDQHDGKLIGAFFVLCHHCAEARIEPHERFYTVHGVHTPAPGPMPICANCVHRAGTFCLHPDSGYRGGTGLEMTYPQPSVGFLDGYDPKTRRRFGKSWTRFHGPVTACTGKITYPPTHNTTV